MKRISPLAWLCLVFVVGCGGGGGTGAAAGGQDSVFGPFQTRAQGAAPAVTTTSSGSTTIAGVAGTAFTKITYAPTASIAATRIAYVHGFDPSYQTLNICRSDGSNPHNIPGAFGAINRPTWSRDGRLAFQRYSSLDGSYTIWVVNADGSNLHRISSNSLSDGEPCWSPDNFHIAFSRQDVSTKWQIYTMTASGGSVTKLSDGSANDYNPVYTSDGGTIYFTRLNTLSGFHELWKMTSTGASPSSVVTSVDVSRFALSPFNNQVVLSIDTGGAESIDLYNLPPAGSMVLYGAANEYYNVGSWSPDGAKVLFTRTDNAVTDLMTIAPDSSGPSTLLNLNDLLIQDCCWEPFPLPIPYVASTGGSVFGTASSGFLYGLNGDAFASFLTFTATTPASATAAADPVTPGQLDLIYRINADAITSIKFLNGFGGAVNALTLSGTVKSAVVAFNSLTGNISSVVPVASKMAAVNKTAKGVVVSDALGAFDAHGCKVAGPGAVVLSKTGEVVSTR